ncbi:MAG TPA: hypothetical protein VFE84_10140 [Patescibacteria group bacterium]|jgi:K+-sensing histidine kinase KdpD|nr:hypothetical protein [Patescibacteria group bacterium]
MEITTLPLSRKPERLDQLVDECLQERRNESLRSSDGERAAGQPEFARQIAADIPEFPMDRGLIKEALACLIREAAARVAPEARLRVTVKANRNALMFAVKAPGPGLAGPQRDKAFSGEPAAGTLARARLIIAAHGGVAWANGLPGKGITYYFSLPIPRSAVARP